MIPFEKPAVGPENDTESVAYNGMADTLAKSSSAVGWAINMANSFKSDKTYVQGELFRRIKGRLPGVDPRQLVGYAVCIYFAEKVCTH